MDDMLMLEPPHLIPPLTADGNWTLAEDWVVMYRNEKWEIPAGFETDGASIPRWLWPICGSPLECPRLIAAIVHDFVYGGGDPEATRKEADDLYRDIQIALGIPSWKASVEWAALRKFGESHWYETPSK